MTELLLGPCVVDRGRTDVGVSESDFLSEVLGRYVLLLWMLSDTVDDCSGEEDTAYSIRIRVAYTTPLSQHDNDCGLSLFAYPLTN